MIRISELKLPLSALPVEVRRAADAPSETDEDRLLTPHPEEALRQLAAQALGLVTADIATLQVFKRSFDARKADLLAVYIVDLALTDAQTENNLLQQFANHPHIQATPDMRWHAPCHAPAGFGAQDGERPVVVGFGPCGMFAALALAQMGFRPIVLERGKPVRERTKDTWGLWRKQVLNPESNVQFGEGGAGTFSDGKLYSQIKDPRHLGRKVMDEFVKAGAPADILYAAHPHIGTFKLVKVVENIREQIIALGGDIRFEQRVSDVLLAPAEGGHQLTGLQVLDQQTGQSHTLPTRHAVLALGHSSRDTFVMLHRSGVAMQAKAFSIGVRIEHPQSVIDQARWGRHAGHPLLGAADYKLVHHAQNGRAVYSFCMCPGGTVVAATSEPGRVVTNGMSQYSRNERNANAGMVVGIDPPDYPLDTAAWQAAFGEQDGVLLAQEAQAWAELQPSQAHPLAGIVLQRQLETRAFEVGGANYEAPGQLVGDFLAQRPSTTWGSVQPSYKPGVKLTDLADVLPDYAVAAMREALPVFGRKIKGYDMHDAVMTGVETRTSSPLKIPRGEDFQSLNTRGLYPAGEGASYAGGILSAGVDGIKVAQAVASAIRSD
ncbi:NAD(P)/FAD-dependent oxidoreductase [Limnohabitans planktonicus]|uniref:FAD-dependent oxidoreductase n=1 Tax=Limnohabitans planktonicus II-D5 TaxID=1293045 RepID=A0A2T7UCC0_9BURK|nr:NAD(P)/FAD-dependent oxidoreductase [Limnohabitans planktonicus]PVE42343.1 FAD-dependent oxidoreductase [Limnohabitans planktonicus II-D5]|eukprot:gene1860-1826_t